MDVNTVEFDQVQIGLGLKPLAQHGFVVVGGGTITLLDSKREPIHSGRIVETTAKKVKMTRGKTLSITVGGEKFNVSCGWGTYAQRFGSGTGVKSANEALLELIDSNGAVPGQA